MNNEQFEKVLKWETIKLFVYSFPFFLLFCYEIGQDSNCPNGYLKIAGYDMVSRCLGFGTPDILKHSFIYDLIFLRAGVSPLGSHWSSQLFFPILYFVALVVSKGNYKFSFIVSFVMLFFHEALWICFEYFYNGGLEYADFAWIALTSFCSLMAFIAYRKLFFRIQFLLVILTYVLYLQIWEIVDSLHVTVTGKIETAYYGLPITNSFEVGGWTTMFLLLSFYIYLNRMYIPKGYFAQFYGDTAISGSNSQN